jgi:hypothetical protein
VYSTGEDVPSIQVNLVSRDTGSEIPLSNTSMNSTYTVGSRSGIGIFDFSIDKPGMYVSLYQKFRFSPYFITAVMSKDITPTSNKIDNGINKS